MPTTKQARKIILPTKPATKPTTKPVAAKPASTAVALKSSTAAAPKPATASAKPATTDKPQTAVSGGGYVNRAATKAQLYGADHQSDRDNAYLRFFASFLRGRKPTDTITYAEIADRQRPANMRNPIPAAGGKAGCLDRGILSRFDKFGHTVNVTDPADKSRRVGFRFSDKALTLAPVAAGMRDVYNDGLLRAVRD